MRKLNAFVGSVLIFGALVCLKSATNQVRSGAWEPAGALSQATVGASAVRLTDGRVLITGGTGTNGALETAELFGPGGSFSQAAPMIHPRSQHMSVVLDDGRVLVAGGRSQGGAALSSAELYDPSANTWTEAGIMSVSRVGQTATLLTNGKVLIAGGQNGDMTHASLEIFDPQNNQFESLSAQLSSPRTQHAAALLPDGRVLIAGGFSGSETLRTTDIFDPRTGMVSAGPDLLGPRQAFTATALLDGKILIAGGSNGSMSLASAEVLDPATLKFSAAGAMTTPRSGHMAFLLPANNRVLLVGGDAAGSSAELFIPWHGAFQPTASLQQPRSEAAGAPVGLGGSLVLAGGRTRSAQLDSASVYRFATVSTDQEQYYTGASVTVTGSGWQPGEKVSLLFHGSSKANPDRTLAAIADASGKIFNNEYRNESRDPDQKFYVTASASRSEGQTVFASNPSANLDQCANGSGLQAGQVGTCSWVNGNVNSSKATYFEGDSVAYRLLMGNLAVSSTNTVTIQWDTTQQGKHALDYITDWNRSVTGNPCLGVSGCTLGSPSSTFAIPADAYMLSQMLPGRSQIPGSLTMWGGTITGVSAYTLSGTYSGNSSTAR